MRRYDVLTIEHEKKLIVPLHNNANESVTYFVHNNKIFNILNSAYTITGHGGIHKMHDSLKDKYDNISRHVI